jgi:hypothetical protein
MGKAYPDNIVFLAACNPYRTRLITEAVTSTGLTRKVIRNGVDGNLLYKVLPPPESMIEMMWNFQ